MICISNQTVRAPLSSRRRSFRVMATYEKVGTRKDLEEGGGRFRATVNDKKVFIQEYEGKLFCLSNVCTHLKLPIVGRTGLVQGQVMYFS